jgi:hypothetical protein
MMIDGGIFVLRVNESIAARNNYGCDKLATGSIGTYGGKLTIWQKMTIIFQCQTGYNMVCSAF